jgi:outer membrane protein OmpA-like peptidoglycan-associated protein
MLATLAALLCSAALAQDVAGGDVPSIDAQLFRPSVDASTLLGTDDSYVSDELVGTGRLLMQWAHQPLVYYPSDGEPVDLVGDLVQLDVLGAFSYKRLRLGVDLPIMLRSIGDVTDPETGMGDLSLDLKGRLLDRRSHAVGLALGSRVSLPTASTEAPLGADGVGWSVHGILDAQLGDALVALNLGTVGTPTVELENLTWDDHLYARLGASYALTPTVGLGAELGGHAPYADFGNTDAMPAEALLGAWLRPGGGDWVLRLAGGSGITGGVGAPKARALLALAYDPPLAGPDRDLDGISDAVDRCPEVPEDVDAWEDDDGCPEPTEVTFAVVDQMDIPIEGATVSVRGVGVQREGQPGMKTELEAGSYTVTVSALDFAAHETTVRIPEGAPYDALVKLAVVPQEGLVAVRVRAADGTPLEGVVTFGDRTPELTHKGAVHGALPGGSWPVRVEVEGYQPMRQEVMVHGGEEVVVVAVMNPVLVQLTRERIEIKDSVYFETARATIKPASYDLLDQIAALLEEHPEVRRVRIEGHTDSRGDDRYNLELSQERAAAVRSYLIDHGVAAKRLSSIGYGEGQPLDRRETEEAWSQNRRVDFWIEERSD